MTREDDEVSRLLETARALSRPAEQPTPELEPAVDAPESAPDPVADLLATAEQLSHSAPTARSSRPPKAAARRSRGPLIFLGVAVVALMLIAAFAVGRSTSGAGSGAAAGGGVTATATAAAPLDQAQVAALMAKIAADPQDSASLQTLGNMYYDANDFANALTFYEKAVLLAPKDDGRWIAVAAAAFQSGNDSRAFEAWNKALAINPDNIEAHYGLGHYYARQTPPDNAKAAAEWQKVVDIDPTSPLAKEVQGELASLAPSAAVPSPSAS